MLFQLLLCFWSFHSVHYFIGRHITLRSCNDAKLSIFYALAGSSFLIFQRQLIIVKWEWKVLEIRWWWIKKYQRDSTCWTGTRLIVRCLSFTLYKSSFVCTTAVLWCYYWRLIFISFFSSSHNSLSLASPNYVYRCRRCPCDFINDFFPPRFSLILFYEIISLNLISNKGTHSLTHSSSLFYPFSLAC